ncbi:MAG: pyruvate dehydrogenase (acetyl-transferring) E1 component subunit alpha [Actinomycetota bacterium]
MLESVTPTGDAERILSPAGKSSVRPKELGLKKTELRELLRLMILARTMDDVAIRLQSEGELLVYPSFRGQEAAQVGSAFALDKDDFIFPTFREFAAAIVHGVDPVTYLEYHRGTWHGGPYDPMENRFGPICITLATQIAHAVGFALGMKLDRKPVVTLAYFGDGSASEGDFHEACNFAAVFNAPVVLFCQNNGWAISVPESEQMAAPIYLRAQGYGFPGVRVDGNDVLAVRRATKEAADRARSGKGPTLIEAVTYRMAAHTTNDDASRYRDSREVARWKRLDPIDRYRKWLLAEKIVTKAVVAKMERDANKAAKALSEGTKKLEPPPPEDLFEFVYGSPPPELLRQQKDISRFARGRDA